MRLEPATNGTSHERHSLYHTGLGRRRTFGYSSRMITCVDVDYREKGAVAACLTFHEWADATPSREITEILAEVEPYEPGQFYRRELPCLLKVLSRLECEPEAVLIDGYVWLGKTRPGLGVRLYESLGGRIAIVGVAKTPFAGAEPIREAFRGQSKKPLWVGAVGIDLEEAAARVAGMHGEYRLPTLLKRVDQLCRTAHR